MSAEDVPVDAITRTRVLLVDDHEPLAATVAARAARDAGVRTVIDVEKLRPGTEELLQHIDVIIAAEHLPSELTGLPDLGAALREMARRFEPAHTCATLGPRGSLSLVDGKEVRRPPSRSTSKTRPEPGTRSGRIHLRLAARAPTRTCMTSCAMPTASRP